MKIVFTSSRFLRLSGLILLFSLQLSTHPSPKSVLGFEPTDDKTIADWSQIVDYFGKLGKASPKVEVREVGRSTNGSPLIVAFISSADNIRNLKVPPDQREAGPCTIKGESELAGLIRDGKTVVSISCSIHSTEIVASQMSMNLAYQLATATDAETKEILDDTILLLIPSSNPDGVKETCCRLVSKEAGTESEEHRRRSCTTIMPATTTIAIGLCSIWSRHKPSPSFTGSNGFRNLCMTYISRGKMLLDSSSRHFFAAKSESFAVDPPRGRPGRI